MQVTEGCIAWEIITEAMKNGSFAVIINLFNFMTEASIPFVVQFVGLTMRRLAEIPLSAVIGRRAAASAIDLGPRKKRRRMAGTMPYGQIGLRAVAPSDAYGLKSRLRRTRKTVCSRLYALSSACASMSTSCPTISPPCCSRNRSRFSWLENGSN